MAQSDESFKDKLVNNTITILLARMMAIFGPIAAGYIFVSVIGNLEKNVGEVQADIRKMERTLTINSTNIFSHEKRLDSIDSRVVHIERIRQ